MWGWALPKTVGSSIKSLVCKLLKESNVAFIVFCQVIHRATVPSHCPWYNSSVDTLNNYLDVVLEPLLFTAFWQHKGLREPKITILKRDKFHLNDQGNYALYRSYRGAILFALQCITLGKDLLQWLLQTGQIYEAFTFVLLVSTFIFNSLILSGLIFCTISGSIACSWWHLIFLGLLNMLPIYWFLFVSCTYLNILLSKCPVDFSAFAIMFFYPGHSCFAYSPLRNLVKCYGRPFVSIFAKSNLLSLNLICCR